VTLTIVPMISGDEQDALTRAKRFHKWRAGVRRHIKRRYNRRVRKQGKRIETDE
jgi:hypothetical protein